MHNHRLQACPTALFRYRQSERPLPLQLPAAPDHAPDHAPPGGPTAPRAGDIRLVDPGASEPAFQRGAVDSFVLHCANVGPPARVRVWHDNSGPHPDWHLQEMRIRRKVRGRL